VGSVPFREDDAGDRKFDLYLPEEHSPRHLVVTGECLTDEQPGLTMTEAVTAALDRAHAAEQLRRQPRNREVVIASAGGGTRARGGSTSS